MNNNKTKTICITGASGYIGSHVVHEALVRGYLVHACVRDVNDSEKITHLKQFITQYPDQLTLFSADMLSPNSVDDAIAHCNYLIHCAATVALTAKDPKADIVDVNIMGTKNIFNSINKTASIEKVVVTSSIAAISSSNKNQDYVFSEKDWNEDTAIEKFPYGISKAAAEKLAWDAQKNSLANSYDLIAINPVTVLGPIYNKIHLRSSPRIIQELLAGKIPLYPSIHFSMVDVRDVAKAHLFALEKPQAHGRYLCCADELWFKDIASILRTQYPNKSIAKIKLPNWLAYCAAPFVKGISISYLRHNLDKVRLYDNSKLKQDLLKTFIPLEQTIVDTAESINSLLCEDERTI